MPDWKCLNLKKSSLKTEHHKLLLLFSLNNFEVIAHATSDAKAALSSLRELPAYLKFPFEQNSLSKQISLSLLIYY